MILDINKIPQYRAPLRLGLFLVALLLLWIPVASVLFLIYINVFDIGNQNLFTIWMMSGLFVSFLVLLYYWSLYIYKQRRVWFSYGLYPSKTNFWELGLGLFFGLMIILALFSIQARLGWIIWQNSLSWKVVLQGLISSLGIGVAEEVLFRGWLLAELEEDYQAELALWINSFLYSILHFIKPWVEIIRTLPQFPGLLLLGFILVWAKRACGGRLGMAIGIHAGLVWGYYIIKVGNLIEYSGRMPQWVTGIDHNPLAGVFGLSILGAIAFGMWKSANLKIN